VAAWIFDLDGVLWDTTPLHARAFREAFREQGLAAPSYPAIAGMRTRDAVELLLRGDRRGPERVDALTAAKKRHFRALLAAEPPDVEIARRVLIALSGTGPLALASSASRENVEAFLDRSGTRDRFQVCLSGDDVEKSKPDPEIYLLASERLRTKAAIVVEDAVSGVAAARAANLEVWGIAGGEPLRAELLLAGAARVIGSLLELLPSAASESVR
jgi:HAD superfamily hydrolase (TIGR01509 family)